MNKEEWKPCPHCGHLFGLLYRCWVCGSQMCIHCASGKGLDDLGFPDEFLVCPDCTREPECEGGCRL